MITVPRMARVLRQVFEIEARELARSMGVIQRERKLNGKTLLLLLVLGWLHHPRRDQVRWVSAVRAASQRRASPAPPWQTRRVRAQTWHQRHGTPTGVGQVDAGD